jgi:hydrogenase-4 component B
VIHARHTREIDHLGGLAQSMPWTATGFLVGATAICGLPPLNGFVSEFLIYNGLFRTLGLAGETGFPAAAFAVPALALMGALAVACFVKVFGAVFLGTSRTAYPQPAHESPWTMRAPLGVLSACCLAIGLGPTLVAPALDRATLVWTGPAGIAAPGVGQAAALAQVSLTAIVLLVVLAAGGLALWWRLSSQPLARTETWGCGYTAVTPRMQYTASSFAQGLVLLLRRALRPTTHEPHIGGFFPQSTEFASHVPEVVLDRLVRPAFHFLARILFWFRVMQQGSVQVYLVYVVSILVLLLVIYR